MIVTDFQVFSELSFVCQEQERRVALFRQDIFSNIVHVRHNPGCSTWEDVVMSWLIIMAFALPIFFGLIFVMTKFIKYMQEEQNIEIESFRDSLIDDQNPVGLSGDDLEKLKQQQAEAQKHLREVISKIPIEEKDGRLRPAFDKMKKTQDEASEKTAGNGKDSENK